MDLKSIIQWFCTTCKMRQATLRKANENLRKEIETLQDERDELSNLVAKIIERLESLERKLSENQHSGRTMYNETKMEEKIAEGIKEHQERERKKPNLIIFGIEESNSEDVEERKNHDKTFCERLIKDVLKVEDETKIEVTVRLGKPKRREGTEEVNGNQPSTISGENPKPRPLLVRFENEKMKWSVLSNAKNLKYCKEEAGLRRLSIVPDQTVKERDEYRMLRIQLETRRANGETGLYISRGKVCQRQWPNENTNFQ